MTNALTTTARHLQTTPSTAALDTAISIWAKSTTREGERLGDLLRDKSRVVQHFFAFSGRRPQDVTPGDVRDWLDELRARGIPTRTPAGELVDGEPYSAASVYAAASRLSSFYTWLMRDSALRELITHNPVDLVRPRSPRAYEGSQALTPDELDALLAVVRTKANAGELVAKRDWALLLFYVTTAHRREEVNRLKWRDVKKNGKLTVYFQVKGGERQWEEVDLAVWDALVDYLRAAGRLDSMTPDAPLWTAHDRSGKSTGSPLSSHSFAANLKRYAKLAGLDGIHVHQLRHTAAALAGDESGDMGAVQNLLGHKNQQTTKIYLPRITVKKNPLGSAIARRLGLNNEGKVNHDTE